MVIVLGIVVGLFMMVGDLKNIASDMKEILGGRLK